jgi:Na+:H+ antiporter, NhaA family
MIPLSNNNTATSAHELVADQIIKPFQRFAQQETASSILLIVATVIALIWSNSDISETYHGFWNTGISITFGPFHIGKTLLHWINDGLMALFFFTVGLEIKSEFLVGELAAFKKALLPVIAALGGMLVPGLIYTALNIGSGTLHGWGIPVATDIAFALGAIAVFSRRLPPGLKVFLAAFAIADDLCAVVIIAIFYTRVIVWSYLFISLFLILCLALANFLWIRWTFVYALLGLAVWFFILGSGIHPTIAGVIVSLFVPAKGKYDTDRFLINVKSTINRFECEEQSCGFSILLNADHLNAVHDLKIACHDVETPLQRLFHALHSWVAFLILPVFALSNTGLIFHDINFSQLISSPVTLGVILGLVIGKPLGIISSTYLAVRTGVASLPQNVTWLHILGGGMLGGIGFTMSLFISGLSFSSLQILDYSRIATMTGSVLSAAIGMVFLGMISTGRPVNKQR